MSSQTVNSRWFCVHKLSMFIYLSMAQTWFAKTELRNVFFCRRQVKFRQKLRNYFANLLSLKSLIPIKDALWCDWTKEFNLSHKLKFYNPYFLSTWWCKLMIFQTLTIRFNRIHSLKMALGCKDIGIRKPELATKPRFLYLNACLNSSFICSSSSSIINLAAT